MVWPGDSRNNANRAGRGPRNGRTQLFLVTADGATLDKAFEAQIKFRTCGKIVVSTIIRLQVPFGLSPQTSPFRDGPLLQFDRPSAGRTLGNGNSYWNRPAETDKRLDCTNRLAHAGNWQ